MRRRQIVTAALALLLGAAACGGSSGGGAAPATAGQLPALNHHVTVNFWHAMAGGTQKPTLEAITRAFNDSQPNVTVNLQVYADYAPSAHEAAMVEAAFAQDGIAEALEASIEPQT